MIVLKVQREVLSVKRAVPLRGGGGVHSHDDVQKRANQRKQKNGQERKSPDGMTPSLEDWPSTLVGLPAGNSAAPL